MSAPVLHHREETLNLARPALTLGKELNDTYLIERIAKAYQASHDQRRTLGQSQWSGFFDMNAEGHAALLGGDLNKLKAIFGNPGATNLFYGYDNLTSQYI